MHYVNRMSNLIRRFSMITAVMITGLVLLSGCGSGQTPDGYYKLSSVSEQAGSIGKFDDLDDSSYAVFDNGVGYIVIKGTPEDITYDATNGVVHSAFGDIPALVKGDKFLIADTGFTLGFTLSNDPAPAKPEYPTAPEPEDETVEEPGITETAEEPVAEEPEAEEDVTGVTDAMHDYWDGYWFGYWTLEPIDPVWKDNEGYQFYVLGRSGIDDEGNTEIHIWDNDYAVADVYGTNDGTGMTELGSFTAEKGTFWDGDDLKPGDWVIEPGNTTHKDTMEITGICSYDDVQQFDYCIRLVKWGSKWSDYSEEEIPRVMSWYEEQLSSGITDPLTLKLPEKYDIEEE
ncbi:MAG: hypothetical protein IJS12_06150 [Lachnospiraceae bacterium]|nr:hypothetical protein [Lachnospiraceae bacterium]